MKERIALISSTECKASNIKIDSRFVNVRSWCGRLDASETEQIMQFTDELSVAV